ncbi:MAG: hypothetical protein ACRDRX_18770 [Pseudonocardiaceae bacterium]
MASAIEHDVGTKAGAEFNRHPGVDTRGSCVSGPYRWWSAKRGPALREFHWKGASPRLIAEQTGAIVSPNGAGGYLYYRSGDFIGIHNDPYGCELVVLTLLSGSVEPLHCYLHLADTPLAEIQILAEATNGLPEGGTAFDISTVPFLFSGQRIPHHRAPRDRDSETILAVQFYGLLLPLGTDALDRPSETHQ